MLMLLAMRPYLRVNNIQGKKLHFLIVSNFCIIQMTAFLCAVCAHTHNTFFDLHFANICFVHTSLLYNIKNALSVLSCVSQTHLNEK